MNPETALRHANAKFEDRFRGMEALAGNAFADLALADKETLWNNVKNAAQFADKPRTLY